ncbi:MAG TPA: hypothetical protein VME69_01710 [Methylocella sp.]|nr:hypothetical protein [Methylocella sp.]
MRLDWWTLGLQTINFGVLVFLLHRFLYKPVLAMIDARKAEVRRQFDAAQDIEKKAMAQLAAVEAERAGIAAEREAALKTASTQGQEMAEARLAQAEHDAQALLDSTRKILASDRERALDEARRLALDLGATFAQKLLGQVPIKYRTEAWIEQIEHRLNTLPEAERQRLAHQLADGAPLTVVTACVLPSTTVVQWKERLHRSLGIEGDIKFEVNLDLIAGAELHFPNAILRYSWQSVVMAALDEAGARAKPR